MALRYCKIGDGNLDSGHHSAGFNLWNFKLVQGNPDSDLEASEFSHCLLGPPSPLLLVVVVVITWRCCSHILVQFIPQSLAAILATEALDCEKYDCSHGQSCGTMMTPVVNRQLLVHDNLDSVQGSSEGRREGKQAEVPTLDFTRYTPDERATVEWMCSKLEMDMITIKGWLLLTTDEDKSAVDVYLREVVAQANQKYRCMTDFTPRYHFHKSFGRQSDAVTFSMLWEAC
ncbi:hypothetical protein BD769DRAFT_1384752 [Suillus cothurnatus]|nr:hypothetical protein BD769DRAFT_1384752 [Suillus cothurnatus]